MITNNERERYSRQIMIPEIGESGQERLRQSRVVIAGCGGLGSPIAIYLAAVGIGTMRIIDSDRITLSNLNRQILHWADDIGRNKISSASEKLRKLNPNLNIESLAEQITENNVRELVGSFNIIVDAMDNLATRYLLNQVALESGSPLFHGSVYGFEGRAMTIIPGKSACLRCVYQGVLTEEKFPIIGVAPAVIGCIQATEVIKYILGIGELLTNCLLTYNGLEMRFSKLAVKKNPNCPHCGK